MNAKWDICISFIFKYLNDLINDLRLCAKLFIDKTNKIFRLTNCPVFDAKIIICLHCMHDYKQPHETNLNIKKKWLPLSLFSHLLVEYEECDRFNPHEGFEILIILSFLLIIISVFCMTNLNYSKQFSLRSTNSLFASLPCMEV